MDLESHPYMNQVLEKSSSYFLFELVRSSHTDHQLGL